VQPHVQPHPPLPARAHARRRAILSASYDDDDRGSDSGGGSGGSGGGSGGGTSAAHHRRASTAHVAPARSISAAVRGIALSLANTARSGSAGSGSAVRDQRRRGESYSGYWHRDGGDRGIGDEGSGEGSGEGSFDDLGYNNESDEEDDGDDRGAADDLDEWRHAPGAPYWSTGRGGGGDDDDDDDSEHSGDGGDRATDSAGAYFRPTRYFS
jgi:hypothetical protein